MQTQNPNLRSAVLDAKLALLDALIAKAQRIQDAQGAFKLETDWRASFAFPVVSCPEWERMASQMLTPGAVLPADSRWNTAPRYVSGPVDPGVAFAVAVGIEEMS